MCMSLTLIVIFGGQGQFIYSDTWVVFEADKEMIQLGSSDDPIQLVLYLSEGFCPTPL